MPEDEKRRMTVWVDQRDRDDMRLIESSVGLASESAAIRFAVRKLARELRGETASSAGAPARRRGRGER